MQELNNNQNTMEMMKNNVVEAKQETVEELVHCKSAFMTEYDKAQMLTHCKHFLDEEMEKRSITEIEQPDIDKMKLKIAVDKEIGTNLRSIMHGITVMALIDVSDYFATRVLVREKSLSKCFKFTMEKAKEMCGEGANQRNGMAVSSSIVIPWIIEYYLREVTQEDIEEYEKELKAEEERKEKLKNANSKTKAKSKSSTAPKEPSLFDQISDESPKEDEVSTEVIETTPEIEDVKPLIEEVVETTPEPKEKTVPQFEAISLFDL